MLHMRISKLLRRLRWLRIARWGMGIVTCGLVCGIVFRLLTPIRLQEPGADAPGPIGAAVAGASSFDPNRGGSVDQTAILSAMRRGLFKSASPTRDRPIADKTIERIQSQLLLGCVLEMEGESVAYIRVKDLGLKRCKVGDSVADLFTVLDIREKSVVISIIDHRVTLSL